MGDEASHPGGEADEDAQAVLTLLAPPGHSNSLGRLGSYEVLEVIGRGGFALVLRAFDDVLHRIVAVKVLAPSLAASSPARMRFLRLAESYAAGPTSSELQIDPFTAPLSGERVVRGGAWYRSSRVFARCAARLSCVAEGFSDAGIGFRVAIIGDLTPIAATPAGR